MFEQYLITPRDAYASYMLGKTMFVDVREMNEAVEEIPAIKNIVHIPFSELESRVSELPADKPVVLFSWVGSRSHTAARLLSQKGFEVFEVDGGVQAWKEEGLPVEHH